MGRNDINIELARLGTFYPKHRFDQSLAPEVFKSPVPLLETVIGGLGE